MPESVQVSILFDRVGDMIATPDFIHVSFDLDIGNMRNTTRLLREAVTASIGDLDQHSSDQPTTGNNAPMLSTMRTSISSNIESVDAEILAVEQLLTTPNVSGIHTRQKRLVGVIIAGLIGLGATFLAAHNTFRLSVQADEQRRVRNAISDTLKVVEEHETRLNVHNKAISDNIEAITQLRTMYNQGFMLLTLGASIQTATFALFQKLQNFREILFTVINDGKLHPSIFAAHQVHALYVTLSHMAMKLGSQIVIEHPIHLFQIEASYRLLPNGVVRIFVHVPTTKTEKRMTVFRHVPLPTQVDPDVFVEVKDSQDIIAVTQDRLRFRTMSAAELHQCVKIEQTFICSDQNILSRNFSTSCLASLFTKNAEGIKSQCEVHLTRSKALAQQLSTGDFVVYSEEATTGLRECAHTEPADVNIDQGLNRLTVPEHCSLRTSQFDLNRATHFKYHSDITLTYDWNIPDLDFLGHVTADTLKMNLQNLETLGAMPTNIHTLRASFDAHSRPSWTRALGPTVISLIISLMFACGLVLIMAYLWWKLHARLVITETLLRSRFEQPLPAVKFTGGPYGDVSAPIQ